MKSILMNPLNKPYNAFSDKLSRLMISLLALLFLLTGCTAAKEDASVKTPADETTADAALTDEALTTETSSDETPSDAALTDETPSDAALTDETSTGETLIDETLTGEELYEKGIEAQNEEDYETAFEYFSRSADLGNSSGMNALGTMYYTGLYVDQSFEKALEYYDAAAEQDNVS